LIQENEKHIEVSKKQDITLTFKIILKYWKKESNHLTISLAESFCVDPTTFLKALQKNLQIKKEHCLEEVWIMQEAKEFEKQIAWIKEIHGRIKINIPDTYKESLLKQGNKLFEDPHYSEKKQL